MPLTFLQIQIRPILKQLLRINQLHNLQQRRLVIDSVKDWLECHAILDVPKDTAEQQRRRNSSVAKLLVGQKLENEQYKGLIELISLLNNSFRFEGIHQQILDDQSAQNGSNTNDCTGEGNIPRSRSSITRSLLLNPGRKTIKQIWMLSMRAFRTE